MQVSEGSFAWPAGCVTVGQRIEYVSLTLLPAKRFPEYVAGMRDLLHERVRYIDPVHEYTRRDEALKMLAKYVPRAANDKFAFELVHDGEKNTIWRWTIAIKIRFTPFEFIIHGLVHAEHENGKITYQREYYDPMESIGVIPGMGFLYKLILRLG